MKKTNIVKKMAHIVSAIDLKQWQQNEQIIFASSSKERKRLSCNLSGGFEVTVKDKLIWSGLDPEEAVKEYNEI